MNVQHMGWTMISGKSMMFRNALAIVMAALLLGAVPASAVAKSNTTAAQISLLDLNTATVSDLNALPGIGATRAAATIAARPYGSVNDLLTKGVVTQSIFDRIKGSITVSGGTATASTDTKKAAKSTPAPEMPTGPVDLNTASVIDLDALPGIGAARAATIVSARPYHAIGDLLSKGVVSQNIFDKIKDRIVVSGVVAVATKKPIPRAPGPTQSSGPVDLNTATATDLDALPGIGNTRAAAIIAARPYASINDLLSRDVVTKSIFDQLKDRIMVPGAAAAPTQTKATTKKPLPVPAAKSPPATDDAVPPEPSSLVDLNTATALELNALPDIGAARSAAIIAARPYRSTEDLLTKNVVSQSIFAKIKTLIQVEVQSTATATPSGSQPSTGRQAEVARIRACGAQWRTAKATGRTTNGETWPAFWSDCNKQLKAQGQ